MVPGERLNLAQRADKINSLYNPIRFKSQFFSGYIGCFHEDLSADHRTGSSKEINRLSFFYTAPIKSVEAYI